MFARLGVSSTTNHCTYVNGVSACGTVSGATTMVLDPYISFLEAGTNSWTIMLDEFRVWSTAQSTSVPSTSYQTNNYPPADLYLDWSTDGSTTFYDRSGNGRDVVVSSIGWSVINVSPVARCIMTIPYIRTVVGFTATFTSGTTTVSGSTMVSGVATTFSSISYGVNYFVVKNDANGYYAYHIIRIQDVTLISVVCSDLLGGDRIPVNIGWMVNMLTFSAVTHQEVDLCAVAVTYTASTPTYSYARTGLSSYPASASAVFSGYIFPLAVGANAIVIASAADG